MWELACLRWHHLGLTDVPRCLHRRQASSHTKQLPHLLLCMAANHAAESFFNNR